MKARATVWMDDSSTRRLKPWKVTVHFGSFGRHIDLGVSDEVDLRAAVRAAAVWVGEAAWERTSDRSATAEVDLDPASLDPTPVATDAVRKTVVDLHSAVAAIRARHEATA